MIHFNKRPHVYIVKTIYLYHKKGAIKRDINVSLRANYYELRIQNV